jgi:hypothetical protein
MRRWTRAALAATVTTAGLVAGTPGGAQVPPDPTLTATPAQAGIGAGYQVRVTGCASRPTVESIEQFSDAILLLELPDDEGGGTWSYSAGRLGTLDVTFTLRASECGGPDDLTALIDVENPQIVGQGSAAGGSSLLLGTDCPPGIDAATLEVTMGDAHQLVEAPTDAEGDWTYEVAAGPADVTVEASCGAVAYPAVTVTGTPDEEPPPPVAPPADPVPGPARFTG